MSQPRSYQPSPLPDLELVRRAAKGDGQALAALKERHDRTVYATAYAILGDSTHAEHVSSETFLEAWRTAGTYDPQHRVSAWLAAIARRRATAVLANRAFA